LVPGHTSGAWNDAAQAYYTRETVRSKSRSINVPNGTGPSAREEGRVV